MLPLAFVLALVLISQGVIQNLDGFDEVTAIDGTEQVIPGGPAASQVAIKQLGTNGGGFFNSNSAVPMENPTPVSNLFENWAILAIPLAFPIAFGLLVKDRRQGRVLLAVMAGLWLVSVLVATFAETGGNAAVPDGVDQSIAADISGGGYLEGKEVRFGAAGCGLWAGSTTGTSNGSVNCMHDSMTATGGTVPLANMLLGEVSPGGVGVGLMGLLVFALLAVFIAGLMVGRTPEYLGKKIQARGDQARHVVPPRGAGDDPGVRRRLGRARRRPRRHPGPWRPRTDRGAVRLRIRCRQQRLRLRRHRRRRPLVRDDRRHRRCSSVGSS